MFANSQVHSRLRGGDGECEPMVESDEKDKRNNKTGGFRQAFHEALSTKRARWAVLAAITVWLLVWGVWQWRTQSQEQRFAVTEEEIARMDKLLVAKAKSINRGKENLILQFVHESTADASLSWICNVKQMDDVLQSTLFVITDAGAKVKVEAFQLNSGVALHTVYRDFQTELGSADLGPWERTLLRYRALLSLTRNNIPTLLSTPSSTWFSSMEKLTPMQALAQADGNADIVAVLDVSEKSDNQENESLNMGFMLFRATPSAVSVLREIVKACKEQLHNIVQGASPDNSHAASSPFNVVASLIKSSGAGVLFMDQNTFVSDSWYSGDLEESVADPLVVFHNHHGKEEDSSRARTKHFGHWFVSEDLTECISVALGPVPTAADRAVERWFNLSQLLQVAPLVPKPNVPLALPIVNVMFAFSDSEAEAIKKWACSQRAAGFGETVEASLVTCTSKQFACRAVRKLTPGLHSANLQLAGEFPARLRPTLEMMRLSVVYTLLRMGFAVSYVSPRHQFPETITEAFGEVSDKLVGFSSRSPMHDRGEMKFVSGAAYVFKPDLRVVAKLASYVLALQQRSFVMTQRKRTSFQGVPVPLLVDLKEQTVLLNNITQPQAAFLSGNRSQCIVP